MRLRGRDFDVDLALVQLPFAQLLAEVLAGGVIGLADPLADEDVEDAVFGRVLRARAHAAHRLLARLLHADLDQIAHDRVHVTADVADLGELRSFDLDERGIGKSRQTARDLRLAHAGRADHQNVLRRDLRAHRLGDLLAPPAIAQRDRHGTLGFPLADDELVQLVDDLLRRHSAQSSASMVIC